jgi:hypothetical protein
MLHNNTSRLEPGVRVRLLGQQHPSANARGTGTIVDVVKRHHCDSTWEYTVLTDNGAKQSWNIVDTAATAP